MGIGAVGLLIALPQVVATARILGFTARQAGGMGGSPVSSRGGEAAGAWPCRFPFGRPWELGRTGYWPWDDQPGLPYVVTLYFGIVALWLALLGGAAGVGLGGAGGRRGRSGVGAAPSGWDALAAVSGGLARYPEKLLFLCSPWRRRC